MPGAAAGAAGRRPGAAGVYRAYVPRAESLPHLRGRLDAARLAAAPWEVDLPCRYEERTADVVENQLPAWTLWRLAQNELCGRALPAVRAAYRSLQGLVSLRPFTPLDCDGLVYNRLSQDYAPLHALCRFFLDQGGSGHRLGERRIVPFLVDMARLFERTVAGWLGSHLPAGWTLRAQERVALGPGRQGLHFDIDLVLYDPGGAPRYVLDTKYKSAALPATADIAQVAAYAQAKGCAEAALVYPLALDDEIDIRVGATRVRSLSFSLDGEPDAAGERLLAQVMGGEGDSLTGP